MTTGIICPKCKESFDITQVIEPIRRMAINDFVKTILKEMEKEEEEE